MLTVENAVFPNRVSQWLPTHSRSSQSVVVLDTTFLTMDIPTGVCVRYLRGDGVIVQSGGYASLTNSASNFGTRALATGFGSEA